MGFDTVEDRLCEANKKIAYGKRSPIDTRKAKSSGKIESFGRTLSFSEGEVIESVSFIKVVKDCKGDKLREDSPVIRMRKVGSDEWFSLPAAFGNTYWEENFIEATSEEAMAQGKANIKEVEKPSVDEHAVGVTNILSVSSSTSDPSKKTDNRNLVIGIGLAVLAGYFGYKFFKKQ